MGIGGNICAACNVAADVIVIADVDNGEGRVVFFEQGSEGFAGDLGEGGDV